MTKGPLITTSLKDSKLHLEISQNTFSTLHAVIKTGMRSFTLELEDSSNLTTVDFTSHSDENVIIVELYEKTIVPDHLIALAPPIYLK